MSFFRKWDIGWRVEKNRVEGKGFRVKADGKTLLNPEPYTLNLRP
jgi:hypothetical protein